MAIDMTINPVAIAAFILTCLGCVQYLIAIFWINWWTMDYPGGSTAYFGVWSREICNTRGKCSTKSGFELTGGQEADFVSKVFATLAGFLAVCAVVAHLIYFLMRRSMVRNVAIFAVGSACIFGTLAVIIFICYWAGVTAEKSLGAGFYLYVIACVICGLAAGFTAWASVKRARI